MKGKILIVDDTQLNRELLKDILCEEYDILEAENGREALDIVCFEMTNIAAIAELVVYMLTKKSSHIINTTARISVKHIPNAIHCQNIFLHLLILQAPKFWLMKVTAACAKALDIDRKSVV